MESAPTNPEPGQPERPEHLIQRAIGLLMSYTDQGLGCEENAVILGYLREGLFWLTLRRRRRADQGVLGTDQPHR